MSGNEPRGNPNRWFDKRFGLPLSFRSPNGGRSQCIGGGRPRRARGKSAAVAPPGTRFSSRKPIEFLGYQRLGSRPKGVLFEVLVPE